jgi:hypothetical protein
VRGSAGHNEAPSAEKVVKPTQVVFPANEAPSAEKVVKPTQVGGRNRTPPSVTAGDAAGTRRKETRRRESKQKTWRGAMVTSSLTTF